MNIFDVTASALTAQRLRLDTIASNLANVNTTRKSDGTVGAYRRKNVIFKPILDQAAGNFSQPQRPEGMPHATATTTGSGMALKSSQSGMSLGANGQPLFHLSASVSANGPTGVEVSRITDDDKTPMRLVYDPSHPDANADGMVEMPNVNVVTEMVDMISATRAYEANVTALQSAKSMMQSALEI